jgi:hypothetical protein
MIAKSDVDIDEATRIWAEYERTHDLTGREHEAVGIDPKTGEIFFGDSAKAIAVRLIAEGTHRPLFFRRVGSPFYRRKGGARCQGR